MKTNSLIGLLVLPLALTVGCAADPPAGENDSAPSEPAGATLDLDLTALTPLADAVIPGDRLLPPAFEADALRGALLQSDEPLRFVLDAGDGRARYESATWALETGARGSVLALRKAPFAGVAAPQDEAALELNTLARLKDWGVPAGEIGRVLQRKAMAQSQTNGVLEAPVVDRYKTFVYRAVGGIEVEGHRAVMSHAPDGSFDRAFIVWPALAAQGHLLRTGLSLSEIGERAREAIAADSHEGAAAGPAALRWKYVATALPSGEVTLKLTVGARLPILTEEGISEPHEVNVDVAASL